MQVANQMLLTEVQEAFRAENQELFEASRAENQEPLANVRESSRAENQKRLTEIKETYRIENQLLLAESRRDSEQRMERIQAAVLSKIEKELEETLLWRIGCHT